MTDNDIIKALERCINDDCDDCPDNFGNCEHNAMRNALDLINRQKAEIEEHKRAFETILKEVRAARALYIEDIGKSRSEAIKEFAERLKSKIGNLEYKVKLQRRTVSVETLCDQVNWILHEITPNTIDNLAKEMTEETT